MTALEEYQRLESTGLWRESPQDDPVEVVISFGTATLVLSSLDEAPLTHWSLSALTRTGTAPGAVIYSPDEDGTETLLISDPDMIGALERVSAAHARSRKRPGRLRAAIGLIGVAAFAAGLYFWLPETLERHVARNIPAEQANLIGAELLNDIKSRMGLECRDRQGLVAANVLAANLPGSGNLKLHVLELGSIPTLSLPGNHVLINKQSIAAARSPEEIAGWIAGELARAKSTPPLLSMTQSVGVAENIRFLFTGGYTPETSVALVEKMLAEPAPAPVEMDLATLDILKTAGVSPSGFARALERIGAEEARIKVFQEAGPAGDQILDDQHWVALQGICDQG